MRPEVSASPPIGETVDTPRQWVDGKPPPRIPRPHLCGPKEWFELGDPTAGRQPADHDTWGISPCCFVAPGICNPTTLDEIALDEPAVLALLARLVDEAYSDDPSAAIDLLTVWIGTPISADTVAPPNLLKPRFLHAQFLNFNLVFIAGTQNAAQVVTQVLDATAGPFSVGVFSTLIEWAISANYVLSRLDTSLLDPNLPILFCGHSMGGAVATICAAMVATAAPDRTVKVCTFGAPKQGDARMGQVLAGREVRHIADVLDPIPALPPSDPWIQALLDLVPAGDVIGWGKFRTSGRKFLLSDAALEQTEQDAGLGDEILAIVGQWLLGVPLGPFAHHKAASYAERLRALVPSGQDAFPVCSEAWNQAFPATLVLSGCDEGPLTITAAFFNCTGDYLFFEGYKVELTQLFPPPGPLWQSAIGIPAPEPVLNFNAITFDCASGVGRRLTLFPASTPTGRVAFPGDNHFPLPTAMVFRIEALEPGTVGGFSVRLTTA